MGKPLFDGFHEDLAVQVLSDKEKGYGVRFIVAGTPLDHWFGNFSVSKERAHTTANRIAVELDLEVQDLVPREYDWVQPR